MAPIESGHINDNFENDLDSIVDITQESSGSEGSTKQIINIEGEKRPPLGTSIELNHLSNNNNNDEEEDYSLFSYLNLNFNSVNSVFSSANKKNSKSGGIIAKILPVSILVLFVAYLIAVIVIYSEIQQTAYWCSGDGLLYVITLLVGTIMVYSNIIKRFYGKWLQKNFIEPITKTVSILWSHWSFRLGFGLVLIAAVTIYLVIDTYGERSRLVSLLGLLFIIAFGFVFSHAPRKVAWRHILWGVAMQFIMALLVLRWPLGNSILQCFADKVAEFLGFANEGAVFVFGVLAQDPYNIFAFTVLPVTIFFSFCTSILFYFGAVQWLVIKLGWFFQITIGTTLCESMNAAASIFLGMTESPLLIKPYLPIMTKSELHAIMTGGFATIAGSLLAAYVSFGVDPALLITACVMNAPAALAISKLFYPELEKTKISAERVKSIKSEEANALHAGCVGVSNAIPLVANIAANLVAFIAFIALFNSVFDWACQLVNIEQGTCTLERTFGYIFMPLAWMMGVEWSDCYEVGQLIGFKVIINEFVAYSALSEFMKQGAISLRSQAIATFALCGFSNISSIGIMLGGLGPMAPERKTDLATIAVRAMIAGSMATFSSACIAGLLLTNEILNGGGNFNTTSAAPSWSSTTLSFT